MLQMIKGEEGPVPGFCGEWRRGEISDDWWEAEDEDECLMRAHIANEGIPLSLHLLPLSSPKP
jgi:hypothetical protein